MKNKLKSVLLIDDDEPTNYFNSFILEETGCAEHIEVAQSGREGLRYLTSGAACPDLIFLDINMPAMNGWEFLDKYKKLKDEQKGRSVLFMLTTSLFSEDVVKAREIPEISGFEIKPLTYEIVDRILNKYFADSPMPNKETKIGTIR